MRVADLTPVARDVMKLPAGPGLIIGSLLAAYLFNALPWSGWLLLARPDLVMMVMLFWVIHQPGSVGQGLAFALGLAMDVNDSMLLGQHALAYVLVAYAAQVLRVRILSFPLGEQTLHVAGLALAATLTILLLNLLLGADFPGLAILVSPVLAALLWAPVTGILYLPVLRRMRRGGRRMMVGQALRDPRRELTVFRTRLTVAGVVALAAFGILVSRFVWLQVIQREYYHTLAEANRISVVPVVPNRGIILDRKGQVLAANYSAYTLEITPSKVGSVERAIDELATVIEVSPRDRRRFKRLQEESKNFESLPIRTRLTEEEVARFAVNRWRFPGFEIKARLFRSYPHGEVASHAIGYIGRINEADVRRIESAGLATNYKGTDHIGKLGIEGAYEKELHGNTGSEQVEIDAGGRAIRALSRSEPQSGNNLVTTLDIELQKVAEEAFQDYRGALVALDPATGDVLALVSKPGFDPNLFVDGIDPVNWDALNNSPDKPLNNRALRGQYPPGSTIKPFMALAALHYGKRTPEQSISDPGHWMLPGVSRPFRDWKPGGHGVVNLHKSVVVSCDTYYYGLANDLGVDAIHRFMTPLGFGHKTGIDIDGELPGLQPSTDWKWQRFKQKWYAGDTISVGIGQGYWLATPLQLASAVATVANGGTPVHPRLVRAVQDARTQETRELPLQPREPLNLRPEHLEFVKAAMIDVTRPGGTAVRVGQGAPYLVAGKTGTAQVVGMKSGEKYDEKKVKERHRDHALFIAFAPADAPKVALALLVENGGHGGSTAGPIAREVFDFAILGKRPERKQKLGDDEGPND